MSGGIISTNLLFVRDDMEINAVVRKMIDREVSSALVVNANRLVVGIITERDIVRKFTLLDLDQKWSKKISTIMTRKVHFAQLNSLKKDMIELHFRHKLRHFPVLIAPEAKEENIVGMVTVTDICRDYLTTERSRLAQAFPKRVVLLPAPQEQKNVLQQTLAGLGYEVIKINAAESAAAVCDRYTPLIVDLEGRDFAERDHLLATLKLHTGPVTILSKERPENGPLPRFLSVPGRTMIIKPFDISYLDWTLARTLPVERGNPIAV